MYDTIEVLPHFKLSAPNSTISSDLPNEKKIQGRMTNSHLLIQQLPLLPIIWSGSPNEQKGTTALAGSIISITTVVSSKLIQLKIYNLTVLYLIDITTVCSTSQTNTTAPTLQYSLLN